MSIVDNFHITPEQEELFYKSCVLKSAWFGNRVEKKDIVFRERNYAELVAQSVIPNIAQAWNELTDAERQKWESAAVYSDQSGWDLFSQDTAYRMAHGIPGLGEPNIFHQYKIGHIHIEAPASSIIIKQQIFSEDSDDWDMSINFFCNLTPTSASDYANMYFNLYIDDGWDIYWIEENLYFYNSDRWEWIEDYYSDFGVEILEMNITIEIHDMVGDLYIDGVWLLHHDQNFVNDWQCDMIDQSWHPISLPAGSTFQSVYSRNSFYNYYP